MTREKFRWRGLKEFEIDLSAMSVRVTSALLGTMRDVTKNAETESVKVAPVETGDLRGSVRSEATNERGRIVGRVTYGTKYALRQHEEFPNKRTPGTQWKYLQQPTLRDWPKYVQAFIEDFRKAVLRE